MVWYYLMGKRGEIRNEKYASQLVNVSGIRYENITGTDIDVFYEIRNKVHIFVELKYKNAEMGSGQEKALTVLVDDVTKIKPALLILASHEAPPEKQISLHNCIVEKYRSNFEWHTPPEKWCVKYLMDNYVRKYTGLEPYLGWDK